MIRGQVGKNPMRVGLVIGQLTQGGAERQLFELARRLPGDRFVPVVFCLSQAADPYGRLLEEAGIKIRCLPRRRRLEPRRVRELAIALTEESINLVNCFLFVGNMYGYLAARRAGIRRVLPSVRGMEPDRSWLHKKVDGFVLRRTDMVLVNSPSMGRDVCREYGLREEKIRVVANGLNLDRFAAMEAVTTRDFASSRIGSVSLFKKQKRIPLLLEIARRLLDEGRDVRFRFIGDGPERSAMLALRDSMGLREQVEMPGASRDIPEELSRFSIFLLASAWEGMPNAVLEAMAAGRPVVASRVTGTMDVVREGESGLLFEPEDVAGAVSAVESLLDRPEEAVRMGLRGRQEALARYSAEAMVRGTMKVYDELSGEES